MQYVLGTFKLLSDESKLRVLMLLKEKELCVCQIMGVLGMSQPLVSRNLSMLEKAEFLEGRRDGKLMFYRIRKKLPKRNKLFIALVDELVGNEQKFVKDLKSLKECEEFQKISGKCDMETFKKFMKRKTKKRTGVAGK